MAAIQDRPAETPEEAHAVVDFWRKAGPKKWFAKDAIFDAQFRERFASLYEQAARGEFASWRTTPEGALAEIILLDQYPRNSFRGAPQMFATDALAREAALAAIAAGHDRHLDKAMRTFIYLPLGHSENLADQERSLALTRELGGQDRRSAKQHHDIIARFGRFPHRNAILGRATTQEEAEYLRTGGFKG